MTRKSNRQHSQVPGPGAIVAARAARPPVETDEIRALTEAAGYVVTGECTQVRQADPGTKLGSGKVDELVELVRAYDAELVVFDGRLTPKQTTTLQDRLPDGTPVFDRYRLILEIFGERAQQSRAQHQVELARLRYDLPRIREGADEGLLNRRTEKGSPLYDVEDRIDRLETKLAALPEPAAEVRERRREEGFDLITLAGYTNAGKSTLLHRLADELSVADAEPQHHDEDAVAAIEDRLFETLETTTRRATIDDRPALVTDTVGFVQDLPHDLVRSFSETLSEAGAADVVVLVVDATDQADTIREKIQVSLDVLAAQDVEPKSVVTALNKIDRLDGAQRRRTRQSVSETATAPVPISATAGTNVDSLVDAIVRRLPTDHESFRLPQNDATMGMLSWLYDTAVVESVEYSGSTVEISVRGRPTVIERARAKAVDCRDR